jgi:SAM-dependent methyltransferase
MTTRYVGSELALFATATNWKSYFAQALAPFIGARVLEVGSGLGANIAYLHGRTVRDWTSLEPDESLARHIARRIAAGDLPATCHVVAGTISAIKPANVFDTILYIDVLEHIADDAGELAAAARALAPGGHLIVLAPAHQFLFSPFDVAIGHFRRYDATTLPALAPPGCRLRACMMLDCAGLLASLANRLLLRAETPSPRQIALWDRVLVPISRLLDVITGRRIGKSVVAVWQRVA